jgi:tetratricopeptide (TPR) repeat protein
VGGNLISPLSGIAARIRTEQKGGALYARSTPYVGRRAFDEPDRDIFFGRDGESAELAALWRSESLLVLHGPAGCGKTSLVRAGLTQALAEKAGTLLIGSILSASPFPQAVLPDYNQYTVSVLSSWRPAELLTSVASLSLSSFLSKQISGDCLYPERLPVFAVIDQLEEVFRDSRAERERNAFFTDLALALHTIPELRIMLVIRTEDLGALEGHKYRLNLERVVRHHISGLSRRDALEAVSRPMERAGRPYPDGVAELVVDDLLRRYPSDAVDTSIGASAAAVEPVQLQVACSYLSRIVWAEDFPSLDTAKAVTSINSALIEFCREVISEAAAEIGVSALAVSEWVARTFIDTAGSRVRVSAEAIAPADRQKTTIRALLNRHLLVSEAEDGTRWYMLANDRVTSALRQPDELRFPLDSAAWDALTRLEAAASALAAGEFHAAERNADDVLRTVGLDMRLQADAHSILGNVAYRRRHMRDAEREYMLAAQMREQLQDHQSVGWLLGAIGRIHAMCGHYSAALEDLQSAVTRLPEALVLQTELAKALSAAGQPHAAVAVFGNVLVAEPEYVEALAWRAQLHVDCGRSQAALDDLHTLRRLSPGTALQPEIRSAYALVLAQGGDAETATEEADAALAAAPDHGVILLRAAQIARIRGAQERAAELFRRAAESCNPPLPPNQLNEVRRWTIP